MNQKQRQTLLSMLVEKKETLLRDVQSLQESSLITDRITDESFSDNNLQYISLGLLEHEIRSLRFIDSAIRKLLNNEDFGLCEECGNPINFERLIALPYASRCIDCQSRRERQDPYQYHVY
jgi:DnaK suppressor protein